jgi:hypothetical protein
VEGKKHYQVKISNRFTASENLMRTSIRLGILLKEHKNFGK